MPKKSRQSAPHHLPALSLPCGVPIRWTRVCPHCSSSVLKGPPQPSSPVLIFISVDLTLRALTKIKWCVGPTETLNPLKGNANTKHVIAYPVFFSVLRFSMLGAPRCLFPFRRFEAVAFPTSCALGIFHATWWVRVASPNGQTHSSSWSLPHCVHPLSPLVPSTCGLKAQICAHQWESILSPKPGVEEDSSSPSSVLLPDSSSPIRCTFECASSNRKWQFNHLDFEKFISYYTADHT